MIFHTLLPHTKMGRALTAYFLPSALSMRSPEARPPALWGLLFLPVPWAKSWCLAPHEPPHRKTQEGPPRGWEPFISPFHMACRKLALKPHAQGLPPQQEGRVGHRSPCWAQPPQVDAILDHHCGPQGSRLFQEPPQSWLLEISFICM